MFDPFNPPSDRPRGRRRDPAGHEHWRAFGARWFGGPLFGRGPMVRRGDVRSAILTLLAEKPMHGYQIIGELAERSGGMWTPSAGSIYPTLQQLEDEGLVKADEREGRRVFTLTDEGRDQAAKRAQKPGPAPWDVDGAGDAVEFRHLIMQVVKAAMQVGQIGTPGAISQAQAILVDTRRRLYRLLAEDDAEPDEGTDR